MPDDIRDLTLRVRVDGSQLKNLGADFDRVGDRARRSGQDAEGAGARVRKFFRQLPGAVKGAAAVFLLAKAFQTVKQVITSSISQGVEYEATLTRIVALAGVAREQVALWEEDLKDLAPRLGKDLGELADGLFFVASAGFRGAEAMDILESSAKASATGLGATKDIANLTTSALKAYATEGLEAAEATDILLAATREGKGEASEYARSLAEVLLPAKLANVEFSELAGSAALLTRLTPNVSVVGTQLKALFIGIQKPSKDGAEALEEAHKAGVITVGTFGELRDLIRRDGLVAGLEELKKIREELGAEFFNRLFESQEARQALNALLNDLDETKNTINAVADSSGAVNKAFKEVSKTTKQKGAVLGRELKDAMVDFGTFVLPLVTSGINSLITVVNLLHDGFTALYKAVKRVFTGIADSISSTKDRLLDFLGRLPRNAGNNPPPEIAALVTAAGGDVNADPLAQARHDAAADEATREAARAAADEATREAARAARETTETVARSAEEMTDEVKAASGLMEKFWADTMSQMRNSASNLFFNVMTGKFNDLEDLASGTFRGILQAASHYFGQLATQRIALSIVPNFAGGAAGGAGSALGGGAGLGGLASRIPGFAPGGIFGSPVPAPGFIGPTQPTPFLASGAANLAGGAFGAYNIASSLFSGDIAGGAGGAIGGAIGAGIASAIPGIGTLVGFGIGSSIGKLIGGFFRKKPRLDIDIEPSDTAVVDDFLKESFEDAISISSRKTGVDYGKIRNTIGEILRGQIEGIRGIIARLPEELSTQLDELLLETAVDTREHFGNDRLLEFDKKGKNIKEELEAFLGGELQLRFLFSIRDFFEGAFAQLGVLPDRAREFIDQQFERFKAAGSREERAAIGQELLELFSDTADVYSILNNNVLTPLERQVRAAEIAASKFGFEGIPSLEQVDAKLGELLTEFSDPGALEGLAKFRQGLVDLKEAIASGLTEIASRIRSTVGSIAEFGKLLGRDYGSRITGALTRNARTLQSTITDGTISLDRRTAALAEQVAAIRQLVAIERAAFEENKRRRLSSLNEQRAGIEEQLRAVQTLRQDFTSVLKSAADALFGLRTGGDSPLSPAEQLQTVRDEIFALQARAPGAEGAELANIQQRLTELFPEAVRVAREGFGEESSAAFATFAEAQAALEEIQTQTREVLVSYEVRQEALATERNEIMARIEAVGNLQFQASGQLQKLIDEHLSNQLALQEELNSLQTQIYSETRAINRGINALASSVRALASRPINVTLVAPRAARGR